MKISIMTLFPAMFDGFINTSIIKRAQEKGLVEIECVDMREFALDRFKHVDDTPYGGGSGMVLKCQVVIDCLNSIKTPNSHVILTAPIGKIFKQAKAHEFKRYDHLIIICGHYEGIDARVYDYVDELISIGDYVLTGGELAAMVMADATIRLLKGSIDENSSADESFENGLLEYPQYTKPSIYDGKKVPEVLLSGHHKNIAEYRMMMSLKTTLINRPDLLEDYPLDATQAAMLAKIKEEMQ
ncbi:MAG: tRNA (guanosine(37)-N1)-methyltransferase TrmD [Erysipelotrichaceae bacterium]|nr:tRNA (guanosine(37)-N1)-methyltransferase TrmD [Erysipelotrichaceae bacterium]MDY5252691.1 tRNA (guanosine(37)-N1)-methyltransferase TrmD [Erysipelotrichaceae bacterium]